jgi:nicotinamidase-related amidase
MITQLDPVTALVLIDLQKGIVNLPTAHPSAEIVKHSALLVQAFHQYNLPVVVVNVNPLGAAWTLTRVETSTGPRDEHSIQQARTAMEASGFFTIVPELPVTPEDVYITKQGWNAFFQTRLNEELQKRKVTGIVFAGIATSVGIESTAREANMRGYNLTFVSDAMTDLQLDAHLNSFKNIFPRIGETGTTIEVLGKLNDRI